MCKSNTIFVKAKRGLKVKNGKFESHMWVLNENETQMSYVSLHKSKSDRAVKGGKIIEFRKATEKEIAEHQKLLNNEDNDQLMKNTKNRIIIVFELYKRWNLLWPKEAKKSQMAYKGLGYIADPEKYL